MVPASDVYEAAPPALCVTIDGMGFSADDPFWSPATNSGTADVPVLITERRNPIWGRVATVEERSTGDDRAVEAVSGATECAVDAPGRQVRLGPLSNVARRGKIKHLLPFVPRTARILDFGCGDNWFKKAAVEAGWNDVVGLDIAPPADVVGDIRDWRSLGLTPHSFDAIIAFEVLEHDNFAQPLRHLLKPDGLLIATTPVPRVDPLLKVFEALRLLQRRTSPHTNLTDMRRFPGFDIVHRQIKLGISQWVVLRPGR